MELLLKKKQMDDTVGVQDKPPQNVPQWYADSCELKAILASGSREASAHYPVAIQGNLN